MTLRASSEDQPACPKCGADQVWRPFQPYPVALQIAFALSFAIFLLVYGRLPHLYLWVWSAGQRLVYC
jgi:hypothetical protein